MAENKTKPTDASVEDYIASRANEEQRADCKALMSIFKRITKQQPKMVGASMVGYGSCRYTTRVEERGRCSSRALRYAGESYVVYFVAEGREQKALLSKLGKHKMGESCLYFKRLADLDKTILEQLIARLCTEADASVWHNQRRQTAARADPLRQAVASARTLDRQPTVGVNE